MHRFHIEPGPGDQEVIQLSEREAHHGLHVLRLRAGDEVMALDGRGGEFRCVVDLAGKREMRLRVQERRSVAPLPWRITLVQALPKGKAMETIVQKAAELGAYKIAPVTTERTVMHLEGERTEAKVEKWRWIAIDAIKQCGSTWLPLIAEPVKLAQHLASAERSELTLVGALQGEARHPREVIDAFVRDSGRKPRSIEVWVGPEGDFTPGEIVELLAAGAKPITLGPLVLRSDTAAIYCLSVLNYELQSLR